MVTRYLFWFCLLIFFLILFFQLYLTEMNRKFDIRLFELTNVLKQEEVNRLKDISNLEVLQKKYEKIKNELAELDKKIEILNNVQKNPVPILKKVAYFLPGEIWLTKIHNEGRGKIYIEGESINYVQILNWIERLKQFPEISEIHFLKFQGHQVIRFTLELEIGGGTP